MSYVNCVNSGFELIDRTNDKEPKDHQFCDHHKMKCEPIKVDSAKKELVVPKMFRTIGIEGEHEARTLPFQIHLAPEAVDLASGIVIIVYTDPDGVSGEMFIEDVESNDFIMRFDMPVIPEMTAKVGTIQLKVKIIHPEYIWKTAPASFYVKAFGDDPDPITEDDPKYSLLHQLVIYNNFLKKYINEGNEVDMDSLLDTFIEYSSDRLTFEIFDSLEDLPEEGIPARAYLIPVKDREDVLIGYDYYMWVDDEYKIIHHPGTYINYEKVAELPIKGADGVIYMMPAEVPSDISQYDQYVWIDDRFEKLGYDTPSISDEEIDELFR